MGLDSERDMSSVRATCGEAHKSSASSGVASKRAKFSQA
jgi:hypothetical protein